MIGRQANGRMGTRPPDAPRDRSFLARYGAIILRGGIASIPSALFRYQGELDLTPQQVWFVSAILSHKWDAELPYPSLKRLAEHTGVSRQKLHDYQRQLLRAGHLIVINRRTAAGGQDTNYFDFSPLLRRLEECLERDKPARDGEIAAAIEPSTGNGHAAHGAARPRAARDSLGGILGSSLSAGAAGGDRDVARDAGMAGGVNDDLQPPVNPSRHTPVNGGRQPAVNSGLHEEESHEESWDQEESKEDPRGPIRRLPTRGLASRREDPRGGDAPDLEERAADGEIVPALGPRSESGSRDGYGETDAAERESLDLYVEDLARELGDRAPLRSSGGRLMNLYRRSGLDMDSFAGEVQRARRTTKERLHQIRGERKPGRPKAAMSYFFAVLEDLLGFRADQRG